MDNIGIIILAAGSSSRMGQSKQLLSINGQPLLLHVVEQALFTSIKHIVVVLGSQAEFHASLLETYEVHIAVNPEWKSGIGSSIKTGLTALTEISKDLEAALFMVGDQPAVSFDYLSEMVNTYLVKKSPIIASAYQDTLGVPVLFSKSEFEGILTLDDSKGAKAIITNNEDRVTVLDCPDGAHDLDTPEDYDRFKKRFKL